RSSDFTHRRSKFHGLTYLYGGGIVNHGFTFLALPSMPLQLIPRRKLREFLMRLALIPKRNRRHIVLSRQIAATRLPAQDLDGHLEIALESYRVHDMPAIQAESFL